MKNSIFIFPISLLNFWGCQKNTAPLTESEKEEIKKEIRQLWDYSGDGITERNADKAFCSFSNNEGVKYIRDEHIYGSILKHGKMKTWKFVNLDNNKCIL